MAKVSVEKKEREEPRSVERWRPFEDFEGWPAPFAFPWRSALFGDSPWTDRSRAFLPAMDLTESDEHYTITVELPGSRKEDLQVELNDGVLTIHGEKKCEREEKNERRCYVERTYGSFSRSFRLPGNADTAHVDASFKDGILTITIPKSEESKPKTIAVRAD